MSHKVSDNLTHTMIVKYNLLILDDEIICKTVSHKESKFLQEILPAYYLNLHQNIRTLLPKFFGFFCYSCNTKNVRIIVMKNLLPSGLEMHHKFDLKGSTYKRKASRKERNKNHPTLLMKTKEKTNLRSGSSPRLAASVKI